MKTDWEKITDEAFASDEEHIFSDRYCRRRAEIQGGITMEKKREKIKNRRFNAGMAATAAAFIMIPAATIGVLHFNSGKNDNSSKLGAAVSDTTEAMTETTAAKTTAAYTTEEATAAIETGTIAVDTEQEPLAVQFYGEKYGYSMIEYNVNYDNVPSIFTRPDGFKFELNDGQYHAGGITPEGLLKYTDFEGYKNAFLNDVPDENYVKVDEYSVDVDGSEWQVYVCHRDGSDFQEEWKVNGWFDRHVLIKLGDSGYMTCLYVHSDITDENLKAFIEGMRLEKLDDPERTTYPIGYAINDYLLCDGYYSYSEEAAPTVEYNYIPEGYSVDDCNSADGYGEFEFFKNDEERIQPCIGAINAEEGAGAYAKKIFDANYVSQNGTEEIRRFDNNAEQSKIAYINYRKEGPCEFETQEGWEARKATDWYDRDVVVYFEDTGYAVSFCVYHEVTAEELTAFIAGMKLNLG